MPQLSATYVKPEIGRFDILGVRPQQPTEHAPIEIDFVLSSSRSDIDGWVEYAGPGDGSRANSKIVAAPTGNEVRGTVYGLAPAAGAAMTIGLDYHRRTASEFPPVERRAEMEIKVAASYVVGIDWFEVGNPRNGPDTAAIHPLDYVLGACSATFGGEPLARPQTSKDTPEEQPSPEPFGHDFGRHGGKDVVPTLFQFGPFGGVPGETPDVKLSYVFNHSDSAGGGSAQANCDGVVAANAVALPGALLDRLTADVGDYVTIQHDPGDNSPAVCGATSNYYVRVSLDRVSAPELKVLGGPFGGSGGAPFEERRWPDSTIVGGVICAGDRVDSIQLTYSNQQSVRHGGTGGKSHPFTLANGERITGISGRAGATIDAISIHTTQQVIGPFGGPGGVEFALGDPDLELVGIFGRSGKELDSIGGILRRV